MHETTAITVAPAERAALALKSSQVETELRELARSSNDITAVVDKAGREQAHRIGMTLRGRRTDIEKQGKAARDDATKFSKAVIAEESRLIAIIAPEEERIMALRDTWDAEQERIKAEAVAKERQRIEGIEGMICHLRDYPRLVTTWDSMSPSEACHRAIRQLEVLDPNDPIYEEYTPKAKIAIDESLFMLREMHTRAVEKEEAAAAEVVAREAERQRVAAEAAELARQRAEQEAVAKRLAEQQAELNRQQEVAAATARAEEAKRQAAADAQAADIKRQSDELAAKQAAFEAKLKAQAEEDRRRKEALEAAEQMDAAHAEALLMNAAWVAPAVDTRIKIEITPGELEFSPAEQAALDDILKPTAPPTLRLGQIGERFGFVVTADFLTSLGFAPAATEKNAKLYHEHDFKSICAALLRHIADVQARF